MLTRCGREPPAMVWRTCIHSNQPRSLVLLQERKCRGNSAGVITKRPLLGSAGSPTKKPRNSQ
eukprot:11755757-Karenia_brevis.AAC.1